MAVMTDEEIRLHEKDWRAAVRRHKAAEQAVRDAEEVLESAQMELKKAERARKIEWDKLSNPL